MEGVVIGRRAFVTGLALSGCARRSNTNMNNKVIVGVSLLRISQPLFLGIERKLFEARGLDVEVRRYDTAQPLADELGTGRIDAGGYVAFSILFDAKSMPHHLRIATAVVEDAAHPISYLLVRKGSGLRGVGALRGKKIGVLPTVAYRKWLEAVLAKAGLAPSDVTIVPTAPPLEVDALSGGGVDALFTGDPMATAAIERGIAETLVPAPVPNAVRDPLLFGTFAIAEQLVQTRPVAAAALRSGLDEAIAILAESPEAARATMKPWLRERERVFSDRYPDTRYLASAQLQDDALDRALAETGTSLRAVEVTLP